MMKKVLDLVTVTAATTEKTIKPNARDIKVEGLTIGLGGYDLVHEATLTLNWGRRYGLLGRNGCGKSILLSVLGAKLLPLPRTIDVYHVVSEIEPTEMSALDAVLACDVERKALEEEADVLSEAMTEEGVDEDEMASLNDRLCEIYEQLDDMDATTAEARAAGILFGLGFTPHMQTMKTREFSGGWRMRIALARALFINPALLVLDGPTAHLDVEAVIWLENYLSKFKKILLFVSHSQDFMNNVCTNILHLSNNKLTNYTGNFDQYVQTRLELEENQMKRYNWQQDQIKQMKNYIARFGHGSAKLAKQAQSKEKTLAKMQRGGLVEAVAKDRKMTFRFPDPGTLPPPVLQLQGLSFGYPGGKLLYDRVDFGIDLDSRIALVGPNGAGKTTLLKLMNGELMPSDGAVRPHPKLCMTKYTQHFVDSLDITKTPLEFFMILHEDEPEEKVRQYLGRYGISGREQTTRMEFLSDGIKSRIVFAKMAMAAPHILLLDEPSNSLDPETIDALAEAINEFKGGVVVVSHDMRLISQVAKEIWICDEKKITRFAGDIAQYKADTKRRIEAAQAEFETERASGK
jgi:ATP-binding cassette subfamily F protein 2